MFLLALRGGWLGHLEILQNPLDRFLKRCCLNGRFLVVGSREDESLCPLALYRVTLHRTVTWDVPWKKDGTATPSARCAPGRCPV